MKNLLVHASGRVSCFPSFSLTCKYSTDLQVQYLQYLPASTGRPARCPSPHARQRTCWGSWGSAPTKQLQQGGGSK